MSDSDSDSLSTPANIPNDDEIESALRRVVREALKRDEEITTNIARTRSEAELGLHAGFFKDDAKWKSRSKDLIQAAVEDPASPAALKKKDAGKVKAKVGTKRKSDEVVTEKEAKRRRKSPALDSEEDEEVEATNHAVHESSESEASEVEVAKAKSKPQPKSEEDSALSEPPDEEPDPTDLKQNGKPPTTSSATMKAEDDDSDLSSVIDDLPDKPQKGRRGKFSNPIAYKPNSKASKPSKSTTTSSLTPQEEEIKRLQSHLLKCGIRKLWHRELAPFDTPKQKIAHLKSMLADIGMTGKFSAEKAKQIKEQRELQAELEATREFNENWGKAKGEDEVEEEESGGEGGRGKVEQPVRRLKPRGLVDLGDSGEESD